jgi:hypothetical protein
MIKAGLIGIVVSFIYVTSLTLLSPFCTLCFTPLLGVGVGYLAGWFDKPQDANVSVSKGIIAGSIAGVGAILGQMLATVISTILVTNSEQLLTFLREHGLSELVITDINWPTILTTNFFCGLVNLGIITGLGAVGGMIWFQRRERTLSTLSS